MKIAFVSCVDPIDDEEQKVWSDISNCNPDVLLLLGDNIYMDYGWSFFSDHPLYCSRGWTNRRFADELYRRYLLQSEITTFSNLISEVATIGATWDDHDFAWNNCFGKGEGKNRVSDEKKKISKSLHLQFSNWLTTKPLSSSYPDQPTLDDLLDIEDTGIESYRDIGNVRIILTDGRYNREEKREDGSTSLLGEPQQKWLSNLLDDWDGIKIICSGSTLSRGGEGWDHYRDLGWLSQRNLENTIALSGDIHRNAFKRHKNLDGIYEVTSSGAARPKIGGDVGNFGILEIMDEEVKAYLYDTEGNIDTRKVL